MVEDHKEIRIRFAPSPTGYLHIGSARTALFNYLFAKRHGGKFILRVEDTDQLRSTVDSLRNIIEGLLWLNIKWDEGPSFELPKKGDKFSEFGPYGPYFQHLNYEKHGERGLQLLESGHAYKCICPPMAEVGTSKCECMHKQNEISPNAKFSIKFEIPKGKTEVEDLIQGQVVFENDTIEDFLIVRPNGYPTYNFAAVCDDIDMKITHVIRGVDHLSNTPKQLMIYNALGKEPPRFGHIPLIHGDDGVRLSKRHVAVSVEWYKDEGFLPEAMVNYLAMLSWNEGSNEEFFTMEGLESKFDLPGITKSPAQFDLDKLIWFNGKYIRQLSDEQLFVFSEPYLRNAGLIREGAISEGTKTWLKSVLSMHRERIRFFREVPEQLDYFFNDPREYLLADLRKARVNSEAISLLRELLDYFESAEDFTEKALEEKITSFCEEKKIKLGRLIHPLRLAVTGRRSSPGMFETLQALGKNRVVRRLKKFVRKIKPADD